ncbi:recombinase family protein [Streptomyces glaucosporus]|uniref:recombinase family protein n=1 Tax=Streptomyces glaucosporus TaxID=284044 RepID=UPI0031D7410A
MRISDDDEGDQKGVRRQEADGRALADRLGWTIAEVITENDTSAFKRRKVKLPDGTTALRTVRPGFRAALDKLASGARDGLLAYDLDRTARDPRDLEDLIDVVEARTPRIPVESVTGSLRLANDADVTMARVMVAVANKASRDTSRRVARKHQELAAEGKPGGGGFRGYGYTRDGLEIVPAEAAVVAQVADWIVDEDRSLNWIAAELNRRGVPTVTGVPWNSRAVRSIVTKPRVASLRTHQGEVVGPAVWPPILAHERWEAVCTRLAQRARHADRSLKRWLTGVLRCGRPECGRPLLGWQGINGPRYWCATPRGGCGRIAITARLAEAEVERQVLDLLTDPGILARMHALATAEGTEDARAELAEDEAQLKQLAGAWARKEITFPEYTEARKIIEARIRESRALLVSTAPRALRTLLAGDVVDGWRHLTPADKREIVLTLLPDGYEVLPSDPMKPRRFDPERLHPVTAA